MSRHDDIMAVALDTDEFASGNAGRLKGVFVHDEDRMTSEVDQPHHLWLRRVLRQVVGPAAVGAVEPYLVDLTRRRVAALAASASGDWITDVAEPIASLAIGRFLGLPESDGPRLVRWIDDVLDSGYLKTNETVNGRGLKRGLPEFWAYINARIEEGQDPGRCSNNGVIRKLLDSRVDGRSLTRGEAVSTVFSMIVGSIDNCRGLLSSIGHRMGTNPELARAVRADEEIASAIVREILRLDCPSRLSYRIATRDVLFRGQSIRNGDRMILMWAAGSRDGQRFDEADALKLHRPDIAHSLAFGAGRHLCIGAPLARLQAEVLVREIAYSIETIEFRRQGHMNQPVDAAPRLSLPVRVTLRETSNRTSDLAPLSHTADRHSYAVSADGRCESSHP